MQTQLHKNNDPARIRVESKKQDTIQKKTDDPNKNLFQKTLETPKSNPFLNALMPPTQSKLSTGQTTDSSSPTITETSAEAPPNQQGHCLYQQKSLTILSSR
ncbi:MAG: hypothetical protein NW226_25945, partial [Microscillaceae bacterium]|nr:hypothetical protein [Microscillaceae bacterium]